MTEGPEYEALEEELAELALLEWRRFVSVSELIREVAERAMKKSHAER